MRVALNVEQLLYRAPGGIGRYTAKLLTLLPALAPDVTVIPFVARHSPEEVERAYRDFGLDGRGPRQTHRPVRLPVPRALLYDGWHLLGAPRLDQMSPALAGIDVIHAPSVAVPPRGGARLVVTVHDVAPLLFPDAFPFRGRWFHGRGLRAATRRADRVITVSRAAAAEIAAHTGIGVDRVRVVPNGVDGTEASPSEVAACLERHQLSGVPYVLWVGSLEPRKNVATLVAAFARLVAAASIPHRLVLVGPPGWMERGLVPVADRQSLGERIRLLGRVSDGELRALYAGADLFSFPSRHEGFGLPVLEAMVQGTAVLASDIPALREVAGEAARLVPAMDVDAWVQALRSLLTGDGADRRRLAAAGRERAAGFSWERTVAATLDVYLEALAG